MDLDREPIYDYGNIPNECKDFEIPKTIIGGGIGRAAETVFSPDTNLADDQFSRLDFFLKDVDPKDDKYIISSQDHSQPDQIDDKDPMFANVGIWGGYCRCPSGNAYAVGDRNDSCKSLACTNGTMMSCFDKRGKWSKKKVVCAMDNEQVIDIVLESAYVMPGHGKWSDSELRSTHIKLDGNQKSIMLFATEIQYNRDFREINSYEHIVKITSDMNFCGMAAVNVGENLPMGWGGYVSKSPTNNLLLKIDKRCYPGCLTCYRVDIDQGYGDPEFYSYTLSPALV